MNANGWTRRSYQARARMVPHLYFGFVSVYLGYREYGTNPLASFWHACVWLARTIT